MQHHLPIAVFDSGVGGLTVVAAIQRCLPHETIVYLGDTARLPYGTKSANVVQHYAAACARFLAARGVKMLVIACNTASAHALGYLQDLLPIPVLGVIEPGAKLAAAMTTSGRIGVLATEGTLASGCYQQALWQYPNINFVDTAACPLFVPLAEEGLFEHPATYLLAQEYLERMLHNNIDTLVLGCTHYPLLQPLIQRIVGPNIAIVNSAQAMAEYIAQVLGSNHMLATTKIAADQFFVTDMGQKMQHIGSHFLGAPIDNLSLVDLQDYLTT